MHYLPDTNVVSGLVRNPQHTMELYTTSPSRTLSVPRTMISEEATMAKKATFSIEDALALRHVSEPQLSPDGTRVVFVVAKLDPESKKYPRNLWMVSAAGGDARPLTFDSGASMGPRWSPDGRTVAFLSDRVRATQKTEKEKGTKQIWLLPMDGGEARRLTQVEGGVHGIEWSPDSQSLLFLSPETPGKEEKHLREQGEIRVVDGFDKMHQIWVVDGESGQCRQLTRDRSSKAAARWSPNGRWIAFEQRRNATCNHTYMSALWVLNAQGRKKRKLSQERSCDTCPRWSPDGSQIAFLHRGAPGYGLVDELAVCRVKGNAMRVLTAKLDRSVLDPQWAADGRRIFFRVQDGVRQHVHAVTTRGGRATQLTDGDRIVSALTLSANTRVMALISSSPTRLDEIHLADADGANEQALTAMNLQFENTRVGRTRVVTWKAKDGPQIEGLLVLPPGYRRGKATPTIIQPHGGPAGCAGLGFNGAWQVLAGHGYAVLAPNFRGSAGYGQAFLNSNADDFGGGDFADVMAGVDMLVDRGIADGNRLGMWGVSYGGFMTAWSIGHTTRLKAAVVGAGVTNLQSFFGTSDIQWFTRHYQQGAPWETSSRYAAQSPITYVDRIKTPTLIYHGDEDRRVPVEQGEQLYVALRERGVPVEFVRYPREGHGVEEYFHMLDQAQRMLGWFDRYLPS